MSETGYTAGGCCCASAYQPRPGIQQLIWSVAVSRGQSPANFVTERKKTCPTNKQNMAGWKIPIKAGDFGFSSAMLDYHWVLSGNSSAETKKTSQEYVDFPNSFVHRRGLHLGAAKVPSNVWPLQH
eukprot:s440_g2.t1